MKKILPLLLVLIATASISQNQPYWKEGFEGTTTFPSAAPTLPITGSEVTTANGTWYVYGVYRSNGSSSNNCSGVITTIGISHIRFSNVVATPDSSYIVTPVVNNGINEFHFMRTRSSRYFTIYTTADASATTTNWQWAASVTSTTNICTDSMISINRLTAKRLKIVGRPGTDSDMDSVWVTSVTAITPVKFAGVSAQENNQIVKLNWNIEAEVNTSKYEIERSADGNRFENIGTLQAKNSGLYNFIDNSPLPGLNLYRVKAISNNGESQYSTSVRINLRKSGGISVFPNPVVNGQINIQIPKAEAGEYTVKLFGTQGNLVYTTKFNAEAGSVSRSVNVANAKAGNYMLEVSNGSNRYTQIVNIQ